MRIPKNSPELILIVVIRIHCKHVDTMLLTSLLIILSYIFCFLAKSHKHVEAVSQCIKYRQQIVLVPITGYNQVTHRLLKISSWSQMKWIFYSFFFLFFGVCLFLISGTKCFSVNHFNRFAASFTWLNAERPLSRNLERCCEIKRRHWTRMKNSSKSISLFAAEVKRPGWNGKCRPQSPRKVTRTVRLFSDSVGTIM